MTRPAPSRSATRGRLHRGGTLGARWTRGSRVTPEVVAELRRVLHPSEVLPGTRSSYYRHTGSDRFHERRISDRARGPR